MAKKWYEEAVKEIEKIPGFFGRETFDEIKPYHQEWKDQYVEKLNSDMKNAYYKHISSIKQE